MVLHMIHKEHVPVKTSANDAQPPGAVYWAATVANIALSPRLATPRAETGE